MAKIGRKLKELREGLRLSVDDVAELMNMSRSNLQKIERDEIDLTRENTMRFSKLFNITVEDLHHLVPGNPGQGGIAQKLPLGHEGSSPEAVTHHISEIRALYDKLLEAKEQTITEMKKEIGLLCEEKETQQLEITRLKNEVREFKLELNLLRRIITESKK